MGNPPKYASILQHHECEGLGLIADALKGAGFAQHLIRSDLGYSVPHEIGNAAGLIIMGGPQSVYETDKFAYLRAELHLIEDTLKHNKPILGVCLGSQLLAAALGAKVYPGRRKEIGWHRIDLTDSAAADPLFTGLPKSFTALHWHGDIFDLPRGATLLASSALTAHQAFRYGKNAYGLLFHLEASQLQIHRMVESFADELQAVGLNGTAIKLSANTHLSAVYRIGREVFGRWVASL